MTDYPLWAVAVAAGAVVADYPNLDPPRPDPLRVFHDAGHATTGMVPPYGSAVHGCQRCGRLVTFAGTPRGRFR